MQSDTSKKVLENNNSNLENNFNSKNIIYEESKLKSETFPEETKIQSQKTDNVNPESLKEIFLIKGLILHRLK
jgi:hypothetical protein